MTKLTPPPLWTTFQRRVDDWMRACFGLETSHDVAERSHRFVEEALELAQARGMSKEHALELVDYVYGRPAGDVAQEVGGVMLTLAALCNTDGTDIADAAEHELARVWLKIDAIRAKQASKPQGSPLPKYVERPEVVGLGAPLPEIVEPSPMPPRLYVDGVELRNLVRGPQTIDAVADQKLLPEAPAFRGSPPDDPDGYPWYASDLHPGVPPPSKKND